MTSDSTLSLFFCLSLIAFAYFYLSRPDEQLAETDTMVRV